MSDKPEHVLRQEGAVKRPEFCTCDDGYWMRDLVDPGCHYHGDYAQEMREALHEAGVRNGGLVLELREKEAEVERLRTDLNEASDWNLSYRKLLTECGEALEPVLLRTLKPRLQDLIRRIREATR